MVFCSVVAIRIKFQYFLFSNIKPNIVEIVIYKKCAQSTMGMYVIDCFLYRLFTENSTCNICKACTIGRGITYNKMVEAKTTKHVEGSASTEKRVN